MSNLPNANYFPTTHWSVVLHAGEIDGAGKSVALEKLCQTYWYPLYAYLRRKGLSEHDAQDHVQSFLSQLIERQSFQTVAPAKGKFRSFLLASLNYFLADQADKARAQKRGGGKTLISFDAEDAEDRYKLEPVDTRSPDKLFEQRWAVTILDLVMKLLAEEFHANGNEALFSRIQPYLVNDGNEATYATVARDLNKSEEAIKKSVQRMRRRYYELFREQISHTVETEAEVEEEIQYLCRIMAEK